jgi:hypothetical protein
MSVMAQRRNGTGPRFARRYGALLAVPTLVVGLFTVLTRPASADAEGHGHGYVWANDASAAIGVPYVAATTYQSNSTGALNTVTRTGTGTYAVRFPNLGPSGTVLVTAYTGFGSTATNRCKVLGWGADGTDTVVSAQCFTAGGVPVDSMFTMTYTFPAPGMPRGGYVWNDQSHAPLGRWVTPSRTYQASSTERTITVRRLATGRYEVRMPGHGHPLKQDLGQMLVVAYGSVGHPAAWCDMQGDVSTPSDGLYRVSCWTPAAAPVNTQFVMTYVKNGNILFAPGREFANVNLVCTEDGVREPCQTSGSTEDSNPAAGVTVSRAGPGEYAVHAPVDLFGGTVQVTGWFGGVTPGDEHRGRCHVHFWNGSDGIRVKCVDQGLGVPNPTTVQVSFVR